MRKNFFIRFLPVFLVVLIAVSCNNNNNNDSGSNSGTTPVEIRLTDAPAPYDAVYINIQSISLHVANNDDEDSGWHSVQMLNPGVYNLLDFRNGVDTLLAGETIPSGKISQIRLVLGEDGNAIVKGGQTYPMSTPSGQQSGIKLNLHDELVPDVAYRLWIDFDALRSIVETGSGKYQLKPVIRAYTEATGGSLKGTVLPQEANTTVWAVLGTDSLLTYPYSDGYFLFAGLQPSASWKVLFDATDDSGYNDSEVTGIVVNTGEVTNIGETTLTK